MSSLEDIKEIGEIKYCFPELLLGQAKCKEAVHIPDVFDILILKIDEMVRRVNELSKEV